MSNEIRVVIQVQVAKGNLYYQNPIRQFTENMTGTKGPTPAAIAVPTSGVDVYFNQLTTPGLCIITNLDATNYVEVGIRDPQTSLFYPLMEVGPGKSWPIYLSRNLGEQYTGSGTGTTTPENYVRLKANGAACNVQVDAFER